MKNTSRKGKKISRRSALPILGGSLLLPFLGFGNDDNFKETNSNNEAYQTLLKSDGTVVKVKVSTIKKSKVIKKRISNKSLLGWITKKI